MRLTSICLLALAGFATAANAQSRPVEDARDARDVRQAPHDRGDRYERPDGRFVLRVYNETLYLLDTESGCLWSRNSSSFGVEWYYEGPRGTASDCADMLVAARRVAAGAR